MSNYKEYIENDKELNEIFESKFSALEKLSKMQIEKAVFYLKSLHSYYEDTSNAWHLKDIYDEKIFKIKWNEKQVELQNKGLKTMHMMALLNAINGVLVIALIFSIFTKAWGISLLLAIPLLLSYYYANKKLVVKTIAIYKEQDRRYFLECLRTAKGCNELDWSGLNAYYAGQHSGSQSDADIENTRIQINLITQNLKDALYNDEYFEYADLETY